MVNLVVLLLSPTTKRWVWYLIIQHLLDGIGLLLSYMLLNTLIHLRSYNKIQPASNKIMLAMHSIQLTVQLNSKLTFECRDSRAIFDLSRVTHQNTRVNGE